MSRNRQRQLSWELFILPETCAHVNTNTPRLALATVLPHYTFQMNSTPGKPRPALQPVSYLGRWVNSMSDNFVYLFVLILCNMQRRLAHALSLATQKTSERHVGLQCSLCKILGTGTIFGVGALCVYIMRYHRDGTCVQTKKSMYVLYAL